MTNTWGTWDDDDDYGFDEYGELVESRLLWEVSQTISDLHGEICVAAVYVKFWDIREVQSCRLRVADDLMEARRLEEILTGEIMACVSVPVIELPASDACTMTVPRKGVRKKLRVIAALTDACAARLDALHVSMTDALIASDETVALHPDASELSRLRHACAAMEDADRALEEWQRNAVALNRKLVVAQCERLQELGIVERANR